MTTQKYFYTIAVKDESTPDNVRSVHLEIHIMEETPDLWAKHKEGSQGNQVITFHYHAFTDKDDHGRNYNYWGSGGSVTPNYMNMPVNSPAAIKELSRLLNSIYKKLDNEKPRFTGTPQDMLDALESVNIKHLTYDGRYQSYFPREEIQPSNWKVYSADIGPCRFESISWDEGSAQNDIIVKVAEYIKKAYADRKTQAETALIEWMQAGKPVELHEAPHRHPGKTENPYRIISDCIVEEWTLPKMEAIEAEEVSAE